MPVRTWKEKGEKYYRFGFTIDRGEKETRGSTRRRDKRAAESEAARIFDEAIKERDGFLAPKAQRDAATRNLSDLIEQFETRLSKLGRNRRHVYQVQSSVKRIVRECAWKSLKDITRESFEKWRGTQSQGGKTLNEYLSRLKSFLKWLVETGQLATNPLAFVPNIKDRRDQRERRALSEQELGALQQVSGNRWVVYVTAACTGLRRGELKQLRWGDMFLDSAEPYIKARASTTKNGKLAFIPVSDDALQALKDHKPADPDARDLVFPRMVPEMELFRRHLEAAGIPYRDEAGRVADFHALRKTTGTIMARNNVPLQLAMLHMRHSDPRLTSKVYTDAGKLPHGEAVRKVQFVEKPSGQYTGQKVVPDSQNVSQLVQSNASQVLPQSAESEPPVSESPSLSEFGKTEKKRTRQDSNLKPSDP